MIGVPKTIDNDLGATDVTFGFDTALHVATEAIDRLHTTAESHHRILVVEVMGRSAGWIALHSGLAGGADVILIPEMPVRHRRGLPADRPPPRARALLLDRRGGRGRHAQGGDDDRRDRRASTSSGTLGWAGSASSWSARSRPRTGFETRTTVLGHVQRGGTPDGVRPGAGHAPGSGRDRRRPRRPVGHDDRAARDRDRARRAAPTRWPRSGAYRSRNTSATACCSADRSPATGRARSFTQTSFACGDIRLF